LIFTSIIKLQIHNYIEIFERKIKRMIRTKKLKRYDLKIQVISLFFFENLQLNKIVLVSEYMGFKIILIIKKA